MKKNRERGTNPSKWKNEARLKLLVLIPSFQEDIASLRRDFEIPETGFSTREETDKWYAELSEKSDVLASSKKFRGAILQVIKKINENDSIVKHLELEREKEKLDATLPLNAFYARVSAVGKKYHLPGNFYFDPKRDAMATSYGLIPYILREALAVPSNNWAVQYDVTGEGLRGTSRWISIQAFAPLGKEEMKEATAFFKHAQKRYLAPGVTVPMRTRERFERDLKIFERLSLQRKVKVPHKKNVYEEHNYLSLLAKSGQASKKQIKEAERMHKKSITVTFDDTISRTVAKEFHTTQEAVRKAKERTEKLAKQLFGITLSDGQ